MCKKKSKDFVDSKFIYKFANSNYLFVILS